MTPTILTLVVIMIISSFAFTGAIAWILYQHLQNFQQFMLHTKSGFESVEKMAENQTDCWKIIREMNNAD